MKESKSLERNESRSMLRYLKGKGSERKLRLFAVAVHREYNRLEPRFDGPASRIAADTAESLAESGGSFDSTMRSRFGGYFVLNPTAHGAATRMVDNPDVPESYKCGLLRCIFGNPFRPTALSPATARWNDGTVVRLAQAIYDEHRFADLPVLADALEEAGCTDEGILGHLREQGAVHVRGCHILDLLLGKS
jgi:hypothetical protein